MPGMFSLSVMSKLPRYAWDFINLSTVSTSINFWDAFVYPSTPLNIQSGSISNFFATSSKVFAPSNPPAIALSKTLADLLSIRIKSSNISLVEFGSNRLRNRSTWFWKISLEKLKSLANPFTSPFANLNVAVGSRTTAPPNIKEVSANILIAEAALKPFKLRTLVDRAATTFLLHTFCIQ